MCVGAGGEDVQPEVGEGVGAQVAHEVAFVADEGFAEDEAAVGGEGAGGAGKKRTARIGQKFIENVVEEDDVVFVRAGCEFSEGRAVRAEEGFGPARVAEAGKQIVQATERGAGAVPGGERDGAAAEVVEEGPRRGAGAGAEVEDAQGVGGFGEGREFGEDMGDTGMGLGREEQRVGGAGAGIAEIRRGVGVFGGARDSEAVGEADDVGEHAAEDVAGGGAAGFGLGDAEPEGFEFGGIRERGHFKIKN